MPFPSTTQIRSEINEQFDEEQVRRWLGGSGDEIDRAVVSIDRHLRHSLGRWLIKQFPTLSPHDLDDVWGDTMLGILHAARRRRFQSERRLLPWLCRIARARVIDLFRRRTVGRKLLTALARANGTLSPLRRQCVDELTAAEMATVIHAVIATLPPRQRRVLHTFLEHYPETRSLAILQREVARLDGQTITRAAVKRALQEGRRKIRHQLHRNGYTANRSEDSSPPHGEPDSDDRADSRPDAVYSRGGAHRSRRQEHEEVV